MRVAIIGAGVSGLACAHELERNGIFPDIYEERSRSGELFSHVAGLLQLMNRPVVDQLEWAKNKYHINIQPNATWKKITMHSPNVSRTVTSSRFGYFIERGQGENSLETQLTNAIKSPIKYNHRGDYKELSKKYDYVVVATGNRQISATLGIWKDVFPSMVRGAVVLGEFNPEELIMWVDTTYALGAYAYLTAFNRHRGSLVLIYSNARPQDMEKYWQTFLIRNRMDYPVVENFLLQHIAGYAYPHQVDNILFVGTAGGFMESFLGFGTMAALRSGVRAAWSIARREPYNKLVRVMTKEITRSVRLREVLNSMRNEDYNRLISVCTLPGLKQLTYNTNLPVLQYAGNFLNLVRPYINWPAKSIIPPKPPEL